MASIAPNTIQAEAALDPIKLTLWPNHRRRFGWPESRVRERCRATPQSSSSRRVKLSQIDGVREWPTRSRSIQPHARRWRKLAREGRIRARVGVAPARGVTCSNWPGLKRDYALLKEEA